MTDVLERRVSGVVDAVPGADIPLVVDTADVRERARHSWYPTSPCGSGCHTHDCASSSSGTALLVGVRIVRLAVVLVGVVLGGVLVMALPRIVRRRYLRASARAVLQAVGVRVSIDDRRPFAASTRGLVVSNHTSYLDIFAIAVITPAHFVAKSEVMEIPVVAPIARRLGIVPVDRASLMRLPDTIDQVVQRLEADSAVAVFPEGTTWCGRARGGFRPAFFQAAIDAGVPVIPMQVEFTVNGKPTTAPGFFGDDSPADTLRRVLRIRRLVVRVRIHESQLPGPDRRALARRCETLIGGPRTHPDVVGLTTHGLG
ncbi:MAG: lysophospholipid acyltransferase family protein [Gordonia sp. (in: high G+C Gram-positive bacteria)]